MYGKRIAELRTEKNMKQSDLAKVLFCSQNTICMWEQEKTQPPISTLIKLCDFFCCTLDYIVGRENEKSEIILNYTLTSDENFIIQRYKKLDNFSRGKLIGYISALTD